MRRLASEREAKRIELREAFARGDLPAARAGARAAPHRSTRSRRRPRTTARQLEAALGTEIERRLARGRRGFGSGDHLGAEQDFQAVLELDPSNETAQGYLAFIERIREQDRQAVATTVTRVEPREVRASDTEIRAEGLFRNALAAERRGDGFEAIRWDIRALRADAGARRVRAATSRACARACNRRCPA